VSSQLTAPQGDRYGRDESIMLEAIVLLLSLATCALILVAFWGLDLLRIRRR